MSGVGKNLSRQSGPCEQGWINAHLEGLGCILIGNEQGTFKDGNSFCYSNSAHLVEVLTEGQMDYIVTELQLLESLVGRRWYLGGGTDWKSEGRWYWANSLIPLEEFVWAESQPNDGISADFFVFWPNGRYYGADEGHHPDRQDIFYPICQKFM